MFVYCTHSTAKGMEKGDVKIDCGASATRGGPYTMLWLDAMMLQGCTYSCLETVKRREQRGKQGILQLSVVICKERGGGGTLLQL